jgi:hypothetical protein
MESGIELQVQIQTPVTLLFLMETGALEIGEYIVEEVGVETLFLFLRGRRKISVSSRGSAYPSCVRASCCTRSKLASAWIIDVFPVDTAVSK